LLRESYFVTEERAMDHQIFVEDKAVTDEERVIADMSRFICSIFQDAPKREVASALISTLVFMIWRSADDFDAAIEETLDGVKHMAELYKAAHEKQGKTVQ
jgi:hypothetical protein